MLKSPFIAALALVCVASTAESSPRVLHCIETGSVMAPKCMGQDFLAGVKSIRVKMHRDRRVARRAPRLGREAALQARPSISGIVAPLAAKVAEIQSDCGSRVISGLRHTFVAGTHRISLHASGKAVDLAGAPGCIYAHLTGWPGGYSTDYRRVRHVHLSYDPDGHREWGVRFVHGRHRYAHRRHHRYAAQ